MAGLLKKLRDILFFTFLSSVPYAATASECADDIFLFGLEVPLNAMLGRQPTVPLADLSAIFENCNSVWEQGHEYDKIAVVEFLLSDDNNIDDRYERLEALANERLTGSASLHYADINLGLGIEEEAISRLGRLLDFGDARAALVAANYFLSKASNPQNDSSASEEWLQSLEFLSKALEIGETRACYFGILASNSMPDLKSGQSSSLNSEYEKYVGKVEELSREDNSECVVARYYDCLRRERLSVGSENFLCSRFKERSIALGNNWFSSKNR